MNQQIVVEDYFINLAKLDPSKDAVLIMDRGFMDNMAYMSKGALQAFKQKYDVNMDRIRDTRYDMVLHLVTAANGAEKYYTLTNNKARTETIEQAVAIDNKIKDVWNGHPNHVIIGNEKTFNEKLTRVYNSIVSMLDYPKEITYTRKFLIDPGWSMNDFPEQENRQTFTETINFLDEPKTEFNLDPERPHISYVKRRESETGSITYSYIMRIISDLQEERMELRRTLTADEYIARLSTKSDNKRFPLKKQISVFVYKNAIYHLETITNGTNKTKILRINSKIKGDSTDIPPYIKVMADITGKTMLTKDNPEFYSQNMAKLPSMA